ncbi:DUF1127 domain-containing protein [Salipiger sp.]|uniref:DUF1127 domain-containing protein n=1 Tax=Salipiger sp. TaxID=2078585 RepID=UPI003A974130
MHPYFFRSTTPHLPDPLPRRRHHSGIAEPTGLRRWFHSVYRSWQRRRMTEVLQSLPDHLLRDIGITRGQIPDVVRGFTVRELGMRPVAPRLMSTEVKQVPAAASEEPRRLAA